MRRTCLYVVLGCLALGGCSVGEDGREGSRPDRADPAPGGRPGADEPEREARAIRGWSAALNRGDFREAASYFADDAVVEQQEELRLPNRAAAEAFNRSLPCRADVTDVDADGATVVATFRLRRGRAPGGGCEGGAARVRFRFRDGKFTEWRQLGEQARPDGQVV